MFLLFSVTFEAGKSVTRSNAWYNKSALEMAATKSMACEVVAPNMAPRGNGPQADAMPGYRRYWYGTLKTCQLRTTWNRRKSTSRRLTRTQVTVKMTRTTSSRLGPWLNPRVGRPAAAAGHLRLSLRLRPDHTRTRPRLARVEGWGEACSGSTWRLGPTPA